MTPAQYDAHPEIRLWEVFVALIEAMERETQPGLFEKGESN